MSTFLVAFAAVFGTSEAIRQIQSDARRKEHRTRKNHLVVRCPKSSQYSPALEGRRVVLSGEKLYIDNGTRHDQPFGHPFAGYYMPYPEAGYSGLVSTICDEPPIMNWIYVDRDTYEIKFGNRLDAEPNLTGPWDCSRQDRRLTFGGWEGFFAVKEGPFWALYFDVDQDDLRAKVAEGTPVLEVDLLRTEMRTRPAKREEGDAAGGEGVKQGKGDGEGEGEGNGKGEGGGECQGQDQGEGRSAGDAGHSISEPKTDVGVEELDSPAVD